MTKARRRAWVERGKSALIAVLLLSAVYLSFQTLIYSLNPNRDTLWEQLQGLLQPGSGGEAPSGASRLAELTRPVRAAVTTPDGRYGVHYDDDAVNAVYEDSASLLAECLLRAEAPVRVTPVQWRQALERTGIYYDFRGDIPLCVLTAGLTEGGNNPLLTQSASRLLLTEGGEAGLLLWFWDSEADAPFQCVTSSVLQGQLEQTTAQYLPNGAVFAFQSGGQYQQLAGCQLFTAPPDLPIVSSVNPLAGNTARTEELLRAVGINPHALYLSPDGAQVARDGSCTIRISPSGTVQFSAGAEDGSARLSVPAAGDAASAPEAVEAACHLLSRTLTPTLGDGRLCLLSCTSTGAGWDIQFGYFLSGAQVELADGGCAARFTVEGRRISEFTLQLRTYTLTAQSVRLLPEEQAVAGLLALYGSGRELLAAYLDAGEEHLSPAWVAQ